MEVDFKKLNRIMIVPFLIDLLRRKKLSLLDFNNRQTIDIYRKTVNANSMHALGLTFEDETIHHWNAFASGTSGCCIGFKADKLIDVLNKNEIEHGKAQYVRVSDLLDKQSRRVFK